MRRFVTLAITAAGIAGAGLVAETPANARTFVSFGVGAPIAYPAYGYGYPAYGYPAYGYYPAYYGRPFRPYPRGFYGGRGYYGRPVWRGGYRRW